MANPTPSVVEPKAFEETTPINCPFELNVRGEKKGVSPIWKYLWGL
jgi:hypothetical protein